MKNAFFLSLLIALPLAATGPAAATAGVGETPRTIVVEGAGEVRAAPDIAHISTGVRTEGVTAAQALAPNGVAMQAVFAALKDAGIAARDMRTSALSLSPRWTRSGSNGEAPRIDGYQAFNQVEVTVRNLDHLGALLDTLTSAGANHFSGVSFDIDKREALADAARSAAVADARRKAELYAAAAGVKLGAVLSIVGAGGPVPIPRANARMAMSAAASPVAAGEQKVAVSVRMVWAIE